MYKRFNPPPPPPPPPHTPHHHHHHHHVHHHPPPHPLAKMAAMADEIFKRTFVNEKIRFLTQISMKFVPKGPIDNNPALI